VAIGARWDTAAAAAMATPTYVQTSPPLLGYQSYFSLMALFILLTIIPARLLGSTRS
jgi:hypothetical protein